MALEFLSRLQSALLSTGYDSIILKMKQVICLETLYLKKVEIFRKRLQPRQAIACWLPQIDFLQ